MRAPDARGARRAGGASAAGGAQVAYFGALQLSTFYLLLGISCQYAFLYFDAYVQSLVEPLVAAALATRVTYMCQRATPARTPGRFPGQEHCPTGAGTQHETKTAA